MGFTVLSGMHHRVAVRWYYSLCAECVSSQTKEDVTSVMCHQLGILKNQFNPTHSQM